MEEIFLSSVFIDHKGLYTMVQYARLLLLMSKREIELLFVWKKEPEREVGLEYLQC